MGKKNYPKTISCKDLEIGIYTNDEYILLILITGTTLGGS
jgi:hypothetical protein